MSESQRHGPANSQHGFTLVELLVALVIGLVITLGAVQLLLAALVSLKEIERLGDHQATLNFVAEMIVTDIRQADEVTSSEDSLTLVFKHHGQCAGDEKRVYRLANQSAGTLRLERQCDGAVDAEPLVDGFSDNGFRIAVIEPGYFSITLQLRNHDDEEEEIITFRAMNRAAIFK